MKYTEFRDALRDYLFLNADGATWNEIQDALDLPWERPCPEWVKRLETDIGLDRTEKRGRALLWRLRKEGEE